MKTPKGERCDSCGVFATGGDKFFDFCVPPSVSPLTGKPDGKFPGIAMGSDPRMLAQLHSCPNCRQKIKDAFKFQDPTLLPPGPLRKALERIKIKDRLRDLRIAS